MAVGEPVSRILAIDPGTTESAWVVYDPEARRVIGSATEENALVMARVRWFDRSEAPTVFAVEMIASYGMPVGAEVFATCVWIGRFAEAWDSANHTPARLIFRRQVKLHLCADSRAKDANIRQALLDRFGGREAAIGKKKSPGPLHGVTGDAWSALAVAITAAET